MLNLTRKSILSIGISIVSVLVLGVFAIDAQAETTIITLGQAVSGQVTDVNTPALYSLTVDKSESVKIQVSASSPGFAPYFQVLDPDGILVLTALNNDNVQTDVAGTLNISSPGSYTITVRSANNTVGQFVISTQAGEALAPPQMLTVGQAVNGVVDLQTSRQAYWFKGSIDDTFLLIARNESYALGLVFTLRDASTNELISLTGADLQGLTYIIPTLTRTYLLEITSVGGYGTASYPYSVCLEPENGSTTCEGEATQVLPHDTTPTITPVQIDPNGQCELTPLNFSPVAVRNGPDTNFFIIGQILPNTTAIVIDRVADNTWYRVNVNVLGWVPAAAVSISGNCADVPIAVQIPTIAPSATVTPAPTRLPWRHH